MPVRPGNHPIELYRAHKPLFFKPTVREKNSRTKLFCNLLEQEHATQGAQKETRVDQL